MAASHGAVRRRKRLASMMRTQHRGVATTVAAGVSPANTKELQPARLPLQFDGDTSQRGVPDH
jgi:hypothetical protein